MVIPPARIGSARISKITVKRTLHTKSLSRSQEVVWLRMLLIVVMKLALPKIEDAPAKWIEKIARSTLCPECPTLLDKGG